MPPFWKIRRNPRGTIYADEFTNVATPSTLVTFLTEARKYRAPLVLATQMLAHMEDKPLRDAFFGTGTLISYRVNADDAEYIANELWPVTPHELTAPFPLGAFVAIVLFERTSAAPARSAPHSYC